MMCSLISAFCEVSCNYKYNATCKLYINILQYKLTVIWSGVAPANPLELTSDPPSNSVLIHSALPVREAQCIGVKHLLSLLSETNKKENRPQGKKKMSCLQGLGTTIVQTSIRIRTV